MHELALFAGAGGGILGGHLLGWQTVCAVEVEDYPRRVLLVRQRDGILPRFPIWDDVCTFDGHPWRGRVDVISGGFPCQDISAAGKGVGIAGARSGLWSEMARIIGEVRPRFVFVENSPMLVRRGLAVVLGDLATLGYDARWCVLGAHHVGAPHRRDRIWILGWHTNGDNADSFGAFRAGENPEPCGDGDASNPFGQPLRDEPRRGSGPCGTGAAELADDGAQDDVAHSQRSERRSPGEQGRRDSAHGPDAHGLPQGQETAGGAGASGCMVADPPQHGRNTWWARDPSEEPGGRELNRGGEQPHDVGNAERVRQLQPQGGEPEERGWTGDAGWWSVEPDVGRVAHGVANRVHRLKAIGNGQVPAVAALAWQVLGGPVA